MNADSTRFRALTVFSASVMLAMAGSLAMAGDGGRESAIDYAEVIDVVPMYRQVTVEVPVRECVETTASRGQYRDRGRRNPVGGMIVGGIIGGLVGNQIGGGHGNDAATIAGTLIGAGIGTNVANRRVAADYPATTCTTRYESRTEQRDDGYRVTYEYAGKQYSTHTFKLPGQRIPVSVSVRPAF